MGEHTHIDQAALETLKEVMEDEFQVLINTFIKDSGVRLQLMKDAIERQDPAQLRGSAHSFKGSCSNIGAPRLAAFCARMEEMAVQQQIEGAEQLVIEIEQELKIVKRTLENL